MVIELHYRGRMVSTADVEFIQQQLIRDNPGASRRALSKKLREAWQWRQWSAARYGLLGSAIDAGARCPGLVACGAVRAA